MTEDQEYIYDSLVNQIKMGFFPIDEIKEMTLEQVEDEGMEDEISEKWINKTIDAEFKKHKEASKNWNTPTDTERLVKAFNELSEAKIIALHNAGYTTSEGEYEVVEVEIELRKHQIQSDGYCFYHGQDLERAIDPDSRNLMISFQKIDNSDDTVTITVGKKVAEILKNNDFEIVWDGTAQTKIEIPNFNWEKVYSDSDEDLLNHNRVLPFMVK
ncbi:hypothetical protein OIU83_15645 [Flavobacterium sp. LS1R49]|uniref:DUF6891 domain-containing protein n=1 Tax=Flavobacterium shii TaxID=2987687 RepID=A0A9X3C4W1_9FLAO|nr:hypothetical protein [Flavobacterium shii]MCV9929099.1 hypothetical protein [Flavobacterium shii]